MSASARMRGTAQLVVAALLFGSTFLVVKHAVARVDPLPFLAVRFLIAAAVLWPLARRRPASAGEVRHGALAGGVLLLGYLLQTYGLQHTTGSRSALITYLLVVIVPLAEALLGRRRPATSTIVGVVLAMAGVALLTSGPGVARVEGAAAHGLGRGEVLTLLCAFCFAAHIVVLGRVAHRHDPVRLTLVQLVVVGGACAVPGLVVGGTGFDAGVLGAAAFTGVFATAVAFVLMVGGQRVVTAERAALLLLIEPVSAAVLGYLKGDRLGGGGVAGAVLIVVAILVAERGHRPDPDTISTVGVG